MLDYEEAVQECGVIFARCCKLYGDKINNDAWMMSLFTISVKRSFHTLARKNQKAVLARNGAIEIALYQHRSEVSNGPLLTLLSKASDELREILRVILTAPTELVSIMIGNPPLSDEAWSRSLCRFARTRTVRSDIIFELKRLLD